MVEIRRVRAEDWAGIWQVFRRVVATADSFAFAPGITEDAARETWLAPGHQVYVAVDGEAVVGSYFIKANQPALGSHIANAAYMVHPQQRRGIARMMGEHSLREAKAAEFSATQFNLVVSTNEPAIKLWRSLGFDIIATVPRAFCHGQLCLVDAYIMYRDLEQV